MSDVERQLWSLAVLVSVLDVATTTVGLEIGLVEANPVAEALMMGSSPLQVMVGLKLFVFGFGVAVWSRLPDAYRAAVPLGVAVPWALASVHNAVLILSML